MSPNAKVAAGVAVGVAIAVAVGIAIGRRSAAGHTEAVTDTSTPAPAPAKVLYWYDPMVPEQHFDHPGLSPMGMEMVPRYADTNDTGAGVAVSAQARQALGVRTERVRVGRLPAGLRVPGTLTWNLAEERTVSLPVQAIVAHLAVRTPFEPVRAGASLATVLGELVARAG